MNWRGHSLQHYLIGNPLSAEGSGLCSLPTRSLDLSNVGIVLGSCPRMDALRLMSLGYDFFLEIIRLPERAERELSPHARTQRRESST